MLLMAAAWWPGIALLALVPLSAFVYLNRDFFRLVARTRGIPTAIAMVPLHLLYALVCVASVVMGFLYPALKPAEDEPLADWESSLRADSLSDAP